MNSKIRKSLMLTAGILFFGLSTVIAQPGSGKGQRGGEGFRQGPGAGQGMCMNQLNLTEEQQAEIADLRMDHLKRMTTLRNQMQEKRARLQTLTTGDNYNQSEVDQVIEQMGDIRIQMMKKRTSHQQEVRSQLTEEQQVLFDAKKGRRMGPKMGHQRGHRGQGMRSGPRKGMCCRN